LYILETTRGGKRRFILEIRRELEFRADSSWFVPTGLCFKTCSLSLGKVTFRSSGAGKVRGLVDFMETFASRVFSVTTIIDTLSGPWKWIGVFTIL
jgi:hypothetical protein